MSKVSENYDNSRAKSEKTSSSFEDVDPINAYFKQRLSKSSSSSIFRGIESDSDSSLGVLDLDNVSEFDEFDRMQGSLKSSNRTSIPEMTLQSMVKNPSSYRTEPSESELNLMKQRELAKKTLMQFNSKLETIDKNLKSLDLHKKELVQPKTDIGKISLVDQFIKGKMKHWFDPDQTPQTPKAFQDELNSVNETTCVTPVPWKKNAEGKQSVQNEVIGSLCVKESDALPINGSDNFRSSDLVFQSQNTDEILNRFEQDEKEFIKGQSTLSNNSEILHFSGVVADDLSLPMKALGKESLDNERMSIGKYFELRSNSINSLVGAKDCAEKAGSTITVDESSSSTLKSPDELDIHIANEHPEKINSSEEPILWKNYAKRWFSTCDLQRISDAASSRRHSNESSESTNTLLIQDLLCGMESGLSGSQINDRLLECLNKIRKDKKEKKGDATIEHMETPKSSKTGGKVGNLRHSIKEKCEARVTSVADSDHKNSKSHLGIRKSISKSCSEMASEFKENSSKTFYYRPKTEKSVLTLKNEVVKKDKKGKGFDSSTPKLENVRPEAEKLKSACSKLLLNDADWELPRVSSIRKPINFSETFIPEESEKTIVFSTSNIDNMNSTLKNSRCIEGILADGDLTILLEKISEMKRDSVCIVRSVEHGQKDILAVVQELATYPKGSVDCSALTPLIRDQYPELLSDFALDKVEASKVSQELSVTSPGSWANISSRCGFNEQISVAVEVNKIISIPSKNLIKDWLILSLDSIGILYQNEKYITGSKIKGDFVVGDFLHVSMKDTLLPPGEMLPLEIHVTPKIPVVLHIRLRLAVKKLNNKEIQMKDVFIRILCVFPKNNITILPTNDIDFGVIPEECCDEKRVQLVFDGVCELPLQIYVDKCQDFVLSPEVLLDGEPKMCTFSNNRLYLLLKQGGKKVLQLKVMFRPCTSLDNKKSAQTDVKGTLLIALDVPTECILQQISLSGNVAFAKFLCNPSCSPLILRTSEIGQSVTREFPLKNVGAIGIEFSLKVVTDNTNPDKIDDSLFTVPQVFTLPKDDERSFEVVFSGNTKESYVRRYLLLQLIPNGHTYYEVELVGIVMPSAGSKTTSRSSNHSGPFHSIYNPDNVPFKLKSTTQSISWAAVPLDVELKQTFHVMNSSNCNAMARFSFRKETSAFKFLNDNGEVLEKLRKVLKPNCSTLMTVIFRPDSAGPHINSIIIETNHLSGRKMISVNGYGGSQKIFIRNLKSDLNGYKIIRLINSEPENQIFHAALEFINKGNIPGFVYMTTTTSVPSLSSSLEIEPQNFVLFPNSKTEVKISQKLKNEDIKRLLSGRDIGKVAAITVTTGDEPSRYRLKKLVNEKKISTSESLGFLLNEFVGEKDINIDKFEDDKLFEKVFRRNIETSEVTVIVERHSDICEPTILEDFEETVKEFVTILPDADSDETTFRAFDKIMPSSTRAVNLEKSNVSASSMGSSKSRDQKITKWLATLEKP